MAATDNTRALVNLASLNAPSVTEALLREWLHHPLAEVREIARRELTIRTDRDNPSIDYAAQVR
jgi:DNA mismatch repair ATPase MutS